MATHGLAKSDNAMTNFVSAPRATVTVMVIRAKEPAPAPGPVLLPLPGRPATSCASRASLPIPVPIQIEARGAGPSCREGYGELQRQRKNVGPRRGLQATGGVKQPVASLFKARQNSTPKLDLGPGPYGLAPELKPKLKRRGTCNSILGLPKPGNKENQCTTAVWATSKPGANEATQSRGVPVFGEQKTAHNFILARTLSHTHKILSERLRLGHYAQPLKPKLESNIRKVNASACEMRTGGLEDYEVGRQLGQGAYAQVKEAVQKSMKRRVALKIYDKYRLLDPQRKNSVMREISLLKKLEHVNVVKLFETISTSRQTILVLELVKGKSLHAYLKAREGRKLPEPEARSIFRQVVAGICYCHQKGIAHRDIKLDNLLLDEQHNIKIIDFGFATSVQPGVKLKVFCGTPSYMAPEIVNKIDYRGPPADMWSLGVLLYVMLCGCHPFKAASDRELFKKIAKGYYPVPQHLSACARQLIARLLEVDPQRRLTSEELSRHPFVAQRALGNSCDAQFALMYNR
jgi:tRNA A-37 threonylcarbamoyl transferase component Bud32